MIIFLIFINAADSINKYHVKNVASMFKCPPLLMMQMDIFGTNVAFDRRGKKKKNIGKITYVKQLQ